MNKSSTSYTPLSIHEHLHYIAEHLPAEALWDDVLEWIETIRNIEVGLADSAAGRVTSHEDLLRELGMTDQHSQTNLE